MIRRILAAALVAGLALLLTATPALAHAKLESTTPAQGASLATPPATVSLTFGEAVTIGATPITVTGPGGVSWTVGRASITDATVSAPVTATGPAGAYTLAWTVISDDGDAVSGKVAFTLTAPATPTTTAAPAPTTTAAPATTAAPSTAVAAPAASSTPAGSGGVPAWVWVVVAVVVLGGIGALVARSRRASS